MIETVGLAARRPELPGGDVCALPPGPIRSLARLREHLQCAIEVEHALLPPYLCALYSLDRTANPAAASIIASVAIEEMFHMATAANMLNAVGGRPELDIPGMLPGYPRPLPHVDESFEVSLLPFGAEALEAFLRVEHPGVSEPLVETRCVDSIGHFYSRIDRALVHLCDEHGEDAVFSGDPSRQVTDGPSGRLPAIVDLPTARAALEVIVEQGEGRSQSEIWEGDRDRTPDVDAAHYYRFLELQLGRRYGPDDTPATGPTGDPITIRAEAIRPMQPNPRLDDQVVGSRIRAAQEDVNQEYCALLRLLEQMFDGQPELLGEAIGAMHGIGHHIVSLMELEVPGTTFVAGPTFEYVDPADRW
jgi:hypothetical protein